VTATGGPAGGAGIGYGYCFEDNDNRADLTIASTATVKAYSRYTSRPAINSNGNSGESNAYYVNAYLNTTRSYVTKLEVYEGGASAPNAAAELQLPATYRCFAYTTGSAARTDNIRAYNPTSEPATLLGTVVRVADESKAIYSVKTLATLDSYDSHSGRLGALPVKLIKATAGTPSVTNIGKTSATFHSTGHSLNGATFQTGSSGFKYSITRNAKDDELTGPSIIDVPWDPDTNVNPKSQNRTGLEKNTLYYMATYFGTSDGVLTSGTVPFATLPSIESAAAAPGSANTKALIDAGFYVSSLSNVTITKVWIYYSKSAITYSPGFINVTATSLQTATLAAADFGNDGINGSGFEITGLEENKAYNVLVVIENEKGGRDGKVLRTGAANTKLTVSNMVKGNYADKTKGFTFTVSFQDAGGENLTGTFNYTGSVVDGSGAQTPANGSFTLSGGTAPLPTLKHWQQITIADVPAGAKVNVTMTADSTYTTKYSDKKSSVDPLKVTGTSTGLQITDGIDERIVAFENTRNETPEVGIDAGGITAAMTGAILLLCISAGIAIVSSRRRREAE
jgi:hypothetical protein